MWPRLFAFVLLASTLVAAQQQPPSVFPSPRLAAVAFAIKNGFDFPRENVVVANEVTYGGTNDVPRLPTDRRTTLPPEERLKDAQALAKLLGLGVQTGWAKELLTCPRNSNLCTPTTPASVFVVEELPNNETVVMMKFYAPGKRMYWAQVDTQKRADGWIATKFVSPPK